MKLDSDVMMLSHNSSSSQKHDTKKRILMVYKISPLDNFLQILWGITEYVSGLFFCCQIITVFVVVWLFWYNQRKVMSNIVCSHSGISWICNVGQ